jgi:hypothetical protein
MELLPPDWIDEVVRCGYCGIRFKLMAEDEEKVLYCGSDGARYLPDAPKNAEVFNTHCPKCNHEVPFAVQK